MAEQGGVYALDRRIVFEGTPADLVAGRSTLTGKHLAVYVKADNRHYVK